MAEVPTNYLDNCSSCSGHFINLLLSYTSGLNLATVSATFTHKMAFLKYKSIFSQSKESWAILSTKNLFKYIKSAYATGLLHDPSRELHSASETRVPRRLRSRPESRPGREVHRRAEGVLLQGRGAEEDPEGLYSTLL